MSLSRLRGSAPILATIVAVVALVSAFATATVILLDERTTGGVTTELAQRSGSFVALRATFDRASDAEQQDAAVRAAVDRTFAGTGVHFTVIRALESKAVYSTVSSDAVETSGSATVSTFSDLASHAVFETGSVAHDEFEVAVQADDAELLGLRTGDELIVSDLPFTVSGTWRAVDPLDPRWYSDARVASGGGDPLGPFVVDESAWARIGSVPLAIWTIVPESIDSITATNLTAVTSAWAGVMQSWRGTVPEYESMDVEQRLSRTLDELAGRIAGLRAIEPVAFTLMVGTALVGLSQIVQLLVVTRERESALFWARGQSPRAVAARITAEVGISAVVGAVVGVGAVAGVAVALNQAGTLSGLLPLGVVVPALVIVGATAIAAVFAARSASAIANPSRGGRTTGRAGRVAIPGVVVLVTIGAALAVWQLRLYGSPLVGAADGGRIIGPVAVAAPAAALVAIVLISLAAFPSIVRLIAGRAARGGLRSFLAARTLARNTRRVVAPLVVVALAVGSAAIAATFSETWSRSFAQASQLYAGADVHVSSPLVPISPIQVEAVARTDGVTAVAPLDVQILSVGTLRGSTLAATPEALRELATTASGTFSPADAAAAIQMDPVGPQVPEGTTQLTLRVEALGFVAPPTLVAWIDDPLGRLHSVSFGDPTSEAEGVLVYTADPGGLAGTIASIDVGMPRQSVEDRPSFRLLELTAASQASEQSLALDQFWVLDTLSIHFDAPKPLTDAPGFVLDRQLTLLRMTASLDGGATDEVRPRLLVSAALASGLNLEIGDTVAFTIRKGQERLVGIVAGVVDSIPGARSSNAVLMDLSVNNHFQLRSDLVPGTTTDLWVAAEDPDRVRADIGASLPADTRIDTRTDPFGTQVLGAASVALWAAALCCVLIAIVAVASASRSRLRWGREEIGSLRAIGVGARDQSSIILRELGVVLLVATVTGLIAGAVVSVATVPQLVRAAVDRAYLSGEIALAIEWTGFIALVGVLAAGTGVVLIGLSRRVRRLASTALPGQGDQ